MTHIFHPIKTLSFSLSLFLLTISPLLAGKLPDLVATEKGPPQRRVDLRIIPKSLENEALDGSYLAQLSRRSKIKNPNYTVSLLCDGFTFGKPLHQVDYEILEPYPHPIAAEASSHHCFQIIGQVLIQAVFPEEGTPHLRLRSIQLTEEDQRHQGRGTQALETLLTELKSRKEYLTRHKIETLRLECPTEPAYLRKWYERFGFKPKKILTEGLVEMEVPLSKVNLYKWKEKKKAPEKNPE